MQHWPTTTTEAIALQNSLRQKVVARDDLSEIRTIAGVDSGYQGDEVRAVAVVFSFPSLKILDAAVAARPVTFPYIPGLLSFREAPAVLAALSALKVRPDLLLCDGQGIAHPRRFGIACHVGVLSGIPSIGCAKSRLVGQYAPVPDVKGAHVPLTHRGETIGLVVRTRVGTRPIFLSVGHRISLPTALKYALSCTTKYRLPEPIRAADSLASHGKLPRTMTREGQQDLFL